jgi:hypothetical protein
MYFAVSPMFHRPHTSYQNCTHCFLRVKDCSSFLRSYREAESQHQVEDRDGFQVYISTKVKMDDAMTESRNEGYRRAKLNAEKKMESNGRNVVGSKEPRHGAGVSLSGLDELAVVEA